MSAIDCYHEWYAEMRDMGGSSWSMEVRQEDHYGTYLEITTRGTISYPLLIDRELAGQMAQRLQHFAETGFLVPVNIRPVNIRGVEEPRSELAPGEWRDLSHDARYLAQATGIARGWLQGPYEGEAYLCACQKCGCSVFLDLSKLTTEERKDRYGPAYEDGAAAEAHSLWETAVALQDCPHWGQYLLLKDTEPASAPGVP